MTANLNTGAQTVEVIYNGVKYNYPAELTASELLMVARRKHPELGDNAIINQISAGTFEVSVPAQRKSADTVEVIYNGVKYNYPAELTASELLMVARRKHPELGDNAIINQISAGTFEVSVPAQRKSA